MPPPNKSSSLSESLNIDFFLSVTAVTAEGCAGGLVKTAAAGLDAVGVNMSSSLSLNNPCPAIEVKTAYESITVDGLSRQYEGVETRDNV